MELSRIDENTWEIRKHGGMRVPGRVYASDSLMALMKRDNTLQQVANVAHLPGIVKHSFAMPDAHSGYGFSIGGVAGFDMETGVVSPGGVGYDINCLSGDTIVIDEYGRRRKIMDLEKDFLPLADQRGVVLQSVKGCATDEP
jgi:tRNA-splicing ligase RtcB (3'-phosphate/5'-hydroxy nucleic acid ligase)